MFESRVNKSLIVIKEFLLYLFLVVFRKRRKTNLSDAYEHREEIRSKTIARTYLNHKFTARYVEMIINKILCANNFLI